jgi:hypothetical protein
MSNPTTASPIIPHLHHFPPNMRYLIYKRALLNASARINGSPAPLDQIRVDRITGAIRRDVEEAIEWLKGVVYSIRTMPEMSMQEGMADPATLSDEEICKFIADKTRQIENNRAKERQKQVH